MPVVRRATLLSLGYVASVLAAGCGEAASPSTSATSADSPTAPDVAGSGLLGATPGGAGGYSAPTTCGGGGPGGQTPFTGALCTCNDANVQGYLRTRAFNSSQGSFNPGANGGGGAVGINHDYVIASAGANAGFTDVGGSLQIAGHAASLDGFLSVVGDLFVAGTLDVKGYTHVTRDAWLGGDFRNTGFAQIDRDLHIQGHDVLPALVGGKRSSGPVTVSQPCACAPSQLIPISTMVSAAKASNDDKAIHLDPASWSWVIGDVSLTLPSGRYYLDSIHGIGNIVLHVAGNVTLFVAGDVDPTGRFAIDLAPAAQIDLYVGGEMHFTGYAPLGDPARPAATRIYAGNQGDIDLTGFQSFVGNLYAPRARVTAKGFVDVWGSLFVRDLAVAGFANFVHDLAVTTTGGGGGCTPPKPTECSTDADCTGQLVCERGKCVPLLK